MSGGSFELAPVRLPAPTVAPNAVPPLDPIIPHSHTPSHPYALIQATRQIARQLPQPTRDGRHQGLPCRAAAGSGRLWRRCQVRTPRTPWERVLPIPRARARLAASSPRRPKPRSDALSSHRRGDPATAAGPQGSVDRLPRAPLPPRLQGPEGCRPRCGQGVHPATLMCCVNAVTSP